MVADASCVVRGAWCDQNQHAAQTAISLGVLDRNVAMDRPDVLGRTRDGYGYDRGGREQRAEEHAGPCNNCLHDLCLRWVNRCDYRVRLDCFPFAVTPSDDCRSPSETNDSQAGCSCGRNIRQRSHGHR